MSDLLNFLDSILNNFWVVSIATYFSVIVMFAIAALHFFWALGGKFGLSVAVPQYEGKPVFKPTSGAIFTIGFLLMIGCFTILGRAGVYAEQGFGFLYTYGIWVMVVAFFLRVIGDFRFSGLFRQIKYTEFAWWDARVYTPVSIILFFGTLIVALS